MFKTLVTLVRGRASEAAEDIADRNALVILDQQLRDATAGLERAKRALAFAIAQDQQEGARLQTVENRIADLEARVCAALAADADALAREGAEAIARLEADRDAARTARALFAQEIGRLRSHVAQAESRIGAVDRGRRVARAAESVRRMRGGRLEPAPVHELTLGEAEATLKRLRDRQTELQAADEALDQIDAACGPAATAEKLAAAGFGPRPHSTADDVLARLRAGRAAA